MPRTARGLHYEVTDLRAPWLRGGQGGAVVFITWAASLGIFAEWLPIVAAATRRAFDMRGFGQSVVPPSTWTMAELIADLQDVAGGVRHRACARDGQSIRRHHRARCRRASLALCLGRHEQCGHQGRPYRLCAGLAGGDRARRHRRLERAPHGHAVRAGRRAARGPGLVRGGAGQIAGARRHWPRRAADRHRPDGRALDFQVAAAADDAGQESLRLACAGQRPGRAGAADGDRRLPRCAARTPFSHAKEAAAALLASSIASRAPVSTARPQRDPGRDEATVDVERLAGDVARTREAKTRPCRR